jgi:hypothetical protein
MNVIQMTMLWDVNACLTPRGVTAHSVKTCSIVSLSVPHKSQKPTGSTWRRLRMSLGRRNSCRTRHQKNLNFWRDIQFPDPLPRAIAWTSRWQTNPGCMCFSKFCVCGLHRVFTMLLSSHAHQSPSSGRKGIRRISLALIGRKMAQMRSSFHYPEPVSSSDTSWIHLSCQKLVEVLSPILLISPRLRTSFPTSMDLQVWLTCFFLVLPRKSVSWKYLPTYIHDMVHNWGTSMVLPLQRCKLVVRDESTLVVLGTLSCLLQLLLLSCLLTKLCGVWHSLVVCFFWPDVHLKKRDQHFILFLFF